MQYRITYACVSHPGKVRKTNQDNFICAGHYMPLDAKTAQTPLHGSCLSTDNLVFGVFDGMGGEQCGEVAAHIAAQRAASLPVQKDGIETLRAFCQEANQAIVDFASENDIFSTGSTAAMLLFTPKKIFLCNIGDSKIFRLRSGNLEQISTDHLGLAPFGVKPPLSQSLGISPDEMTIDPYCLKLGYTPEDIYLICSDGLTDMVTTAEIQQFLSHTPIDSAAEQLLALALEKGGKDNTTVLLCKIGKVSRWPFLRKN